jgi:hypothetical protein
MGPPPNGLPKLHGDGSSRRKWQLTAGMVRVHDVLQPKEMPRENRKTRLDLRSRWSYQAHITRGHSRAGPL